MHKKFTKLLEVIFYLIQLMLVMPGVPLNQSFGMEHLLIASINLYLPTIQIQINKKKALDYVMGRVDAIIRSHMYKIFNGHHLLKFNA